MKTIVLDGLYMNTKDAAFDYLKWRLNLPDYFGRNLDALYDLLTEPCEPTQIVLYRKNLMLAALGEYGEMLLTVLRDAAKQNRMLLFFEDV